MAVLKKAQLRGSHALQALHARSGPALAAGVVRIQKQKQMQMQATAASASPSRNNKTARLESAEATEAAERLQNEQFMARGYPPGPTRSKAKKLALRDMDTYVSLHREFGDVFMLPLGKMPLVVTRSPEHIRSILGGKAMSCFPRPARTIESVQLLFGRAQIALDGPVHSENKRMLSRWLFAEEHNAAMVARLRPVCDQYVECLASGAKRGGEKGVEVYGLAELASVDLNGVISLGRSYGALERGRSAELEALKRADEIFLFRAMNKNWRKTETEETAAAFEAAKQTLLATFTARAADARADDGLGSATKSAVHHMTAQNAANVSPSCPAGHTPTPVELASNLVGFLAGVGNSARLLCVVVEMLCRHPRMQQRVLAEMHAVMSGLSHEDALAAAAAGERVARVTDEGQMTYAQVSKLGYLKCFVHECLRMYPPSVSVAPRTCDQESSLGRFVIPSGTTVMCNIHGAHHHPTMWPHSEQFRPMRFAEHADAAADDGPVELAAVMPMAFFPFGYGGHGCIGKNLAHLATLISTAGLVGQYALSPPSGEPPATFNTTNSTQIFGFMEPIGGLRVLLDRRPEGVLRTASVEHVAAPRPSRPMTDEESVASSASPVADGPREELSWAEVTRHVTADDCWIVLDGDVYDVTSFLSSHPGGRQILLKQAGKDASRLFAAVQHSTFAIKESKRYRVGRLSISAKL